MTLIVILHVEKQLCEEFNPISGTIKQYVLTAALNTFQYLVLLLWL